ncbi:CoA-ligase [Pseudomassariella vexata]|uniref:CoA-ligase n=1 Tax=Pseudomassariella vexata TaxID=1141098 RepID=A0A1Y2E4J7_9PEZI|nr:CoA-ligase [Pseudomassariella vexata]ORY66480.1 CoA-ligase [Pseudomassariella vexata]
MRLRNYRLQVSVKLPRSNYTHPFSTSRASHNYDATLKNLKIGRHTRVIFQGFTGKQATANAKESLEWGTDIVGGVTPGREGEHLGLPVLPTVRKAVEVLKPDATGIYVSAHQATAAIVEAIEAEVPLIVAVAEHIPLHDLLRVINFFSCIHAILKTQSVSRLIGANSPGIISAVGRCRIGFQPLPCFEPGIIGIVARSGTLSYERAAASTLRSGLGQSMCLGVGGDIVPGTTLTDGLKILAEDADTEGIALVGEIGGNAELEAADWIKQYRATTKTPNIWRPIVALVAGVNAVPGRIMGHAGAFTLPGEPTAPAKIEALKSAGATIINHPSRFGSVLKTMLAGAMPTGGGIASPRTASQGRGMHTLARRPRSTNNTTTAAFSPQTQKRNISLTQTTTLDLLREHGIAITDPEAPASGPQRFLAISINRSSRSPCIVVSTTSDTSTSQVFDFDYNKGAADLPLSSIATALGLDSLCLPSITHLLTELTTLFAEKEAYLLSTLLTINNPAQPIISISSAHLHLDDAALHSSGRQSEIHSLRNLSLEDPAELSVEKYGIAYIKLPDPNANIGTLVNGAGLAMNTVDALADAGGKAANFLDTGGKATSETVKRAFEVILRDSRVKCIFVNIFGGLTLGDMIARGIVMTFEDLHMSVPVVVRIRGTNEDEGRRIIAESRLPLFAFDDFDEAAAKATELANGAA